MRNRNRKWVERLAVSAVRALNTSAVPQTMTVIYARLWMRPGAPWTISALAEATSLDRASVREHLNNMPDGHVSRTADGFVLTQAGEKEAYSLTARFYRAFAPHDRRHIKHFFSTKYAGQEPFRKLSEFFIDIDKCTRRIPPSIAFRTVLTSMDILAPRGTQWTISQLSYETGYSYQAVHKVLQPMTAQGLAVKQDKTFTITRKGRLTCVGYFFSAIRRADMRLLKILFDMAVFHDPPPK